MKRIRIIPVLLVKSQQLVKTVRFKNPRYVGDPINAVRIFNDKEVDELCILDIQATPERREPDYDYLQQMASEAFMPIGYGGGLQSMEQVNRVFRAGIEKVILNSAAFLNPDLITQASRKYGSSSVVVSMDIKKNFFGTATVYVSGGRVNTKMSPVGFASQAEKLGAGEIILNSIDREGTFSGFDIQLIRSVSENVRIPVIALGGAGSLQHFSQAIHEGRASAVAAGSYFVFQRPHNAVLITYPEQSVLKQTLYVKQTG